MNAGVAENELKPGETWQNGAEFLSRLAECLPSLRARSLAFWSTKKFDDETETTGMKGGWTGTFQQLADYLAKT